MKDPNPYISKLTPIDQMGSFWSTYTGNTIGRAIHYLYNICNLDIAEQAIFNGDNTVTYRGVKLADIDWSFGYPLFTFVEGYKTFQTAQKILLEEKKAKPAKRNLIWRQDKPNQDSVYTVIENNKVVYYMTQLGVLWYLIDPNDYRLVDNSQFRHDIMERVEYGEVK